MRVLRRTLRGLTTSPGPPLLSLLSVALIFLVVGALALIYLNLDRAFASWQAQFRMVVALRPALSRERLICLERELAALPGAAGAEYVDSTAALEALEARLGTAGRGTRALEILADNPLPATFRLAVKPAHLAPERLKALARRAEGLEGVAEVRWPQEWASRFWSFFRLFKLVALVTCGLLFVTTAFIISSQIRLSLALRRREIGLLRLLGATSVHVGAPYVLEGALVGLAGAALAVGGLFVLFRLLVARAGTELDSLLSGVSFLPLEAGAALIGFGAAVGVLGSLVSLRRLS